MLLNFFTGLSVVLLLATLVIWICSYWFDLHAGWERVEITEHIVEVEERIGLFSSRGRLAYAMGRFQNFDYLLPGVTRPPASLREGWGVFRGDFRPWHHQERDEHFVLGFGTNHDGERWNRQDWTVASFPHALVAMLWLVLPAWRWAGLRYRLDWRATATGAMASYALLLGLGWTLVFWTPLGVLIACCIGLMTFWQSSVSLYHRWQARLARRNAGRCRVCGYDLRATPDADGPLLERCPECGTFSQPVSFR